MVEKNRGQNLAGIDREKVRQEILRKKEDRLLGHMEEASVIQTDLTLEGDIEENVQKSHFKEAKKRNPNSWIQ
jgi:hypothetical protein